MRKFFLILLVAGFVIGMSQQVDAQTYMTRTTLSAAINNSQATITVASGTNFSAGQFVWVNDEAMQISSVSGTSIRVIRGILGTRAQAQASGDAAFTGAGNHFQQIDPETGEACSEGTGQALYLPWINVQRAILWQCYSSAWRGARAAILVESSTPTTLP